MKLDPITEYILFKDIKLTEDGIVIPSSIFILGVSALTIALKTASFRIYKDYIDKYGKKCRDFKHGTAVRIICELSIKQKALEKRVKSLQNGKKYCKKTKDQQKCSVEIDKEIKEIMKDIKNIKDRLSYLKTQKVYVGKKNK